MGVLRVDNNAEELVGLVILIKDVWFGWCACLHSHRHNSLLLILEQHKVLGSQWHIILHLAVLAVVVGIGFVSFFGGHLATLVESESRKDDRFVSGFFVRHMDFHQ